MRRCTIRLIFVLVSPGTLPAQPEPVREFCRDATFAELCPGEDCPCVNDTLEVVFEGQLGSSNYEYDVFDADEIIRARVLLDTVSDQIRGYSFGVEFDTEDINPLIGPEGLNINGGPAQMDPPTASRCDECCCVRLFVDNGVRRGFVMATVLSFQLPIVLPVGRNILLNANFRLERDVGPEGTLLRFSEELGGPPVQIVLTVDQLAFPDMVHRGEGNCIDQVDNDSDRLVDRDDPDCVVRTGVSRVPRTLVDAVVRRHVERASFRRGDSDGNGVANVLDAVRLAGIIVGIAPPSFRCDALLDANDDGRVDLSDAVMIADHAVRDGPPPPAPFNECGKDRTFDQLVCFETNCR